MNLNNKLFHIGVLFMSVIFLFLGNRIAGAGLQERIDIGEFAFYTGIVTQIVERVEEQVSDFVNTSIIFEVRITDRPRRGEEITAAQLQSDFFITGDREVEVGDRVLIVYNDFMSEYFFHDFSRINAVLILGAALFVLIILFGRAKGLNAIVSLAFTCLAVFLVFIPAILSGRNIYMTTIIVCLFSIVSTLLIVIGPNKKAISAMLGCLGGVLLAAFLMLVMDGVLNLTGVVDQESQMLLRLPTENPINLRAIIFAGVILGAVGAIMDVAMSISSSLWEVREASKVYNFRSLIKSGNNIGRDILGTMLNTLILAYIGSSLSLILVIVVHTPSYAELFNMELIVIEFVRALVGAFGMFLTIPLTAAICGYLYTSGGKDEEIVVLRGSNRLRGTEKSD